MNTFIVILFASFIGYSHQADWSYDYETQWPGVCRTGTQQSPINIMTRDAVVDTHGAHIRGPLVFRGYQDVKLEGLNNGHTLKWNKVEGRPAPVLSGGPLRGNYTFLQFHLHWLSEHAIDGMKYPLEIHMVHIKSGLTVNEALARPDGLAVIGILCQVRTDAYHALEQIMPGVSGLKDHNHGPVEPSFIDITRLLSPEPQSYYTYHGSLTTPDCQEAVTWIVMDKPLSIAHTQYNIFSQVNIGGIENYRSLQPTNRVVYRSMASCSSMLSPSSLGLLATLVSCLTSNLTAAIGKGVCIISNIKKKLFGDSLKQCSKLIN